MKVLVTGGSGYFGSLLVEKLLKNGFEVGSLDINEPNKPNEKVRFHKVDVRDSDKLNRAFKDYNIIFNNIAQVPLAKDKKLFDGVNVQGMKNVCDACLSNGVSKLVHTSSSAVYGVPKSNPVNEDTKPTPAESYGYAKLEAEKICQYYSSRGLNVSIIRPRTIIGHGRLGIFSILFQWISEGVNIPVLDKGQNIYQFVHAEDLADACILAANYDQSYSSYNIGASDYTTMRQTLEPLCTFANTGSKVYSLPLKPVEILMNVGSILGLIPLGPYHSLMYGRSLYFNCDRAKKELGFKPKKFTNEMFRESYEWYLKNALHKSFGDGHSAHTKPANEKLLRFIRWIK